MRVRIIKHSHGVMDGVSLSALLPGLTYEVPVPLGAWLVAQKAAEEDVSPTVAIVIPLEDAPSVMSGGVSVTPPTDREDDRPPRRPRTRKKH